MKYEADIVGSDGDISFMSHPDFVEAYNEVLKTDTRGYLGTQDIRWRIHFMLWGAKIASNIEGDFVDCGGGFGYFMSSIYKYLDFEKLDKTYFMFDSFSGHKPGGVNPFTKYGDWHTDVVSNHGHKKNLKIVKGYLPETLNDVNIEKISLLSVDLNGVDAEIGCLDLLWDRISVGGMIILDDYGFPGCNPQKVAHDHFFTSKNKLILTSPTGQGIVIK